MSNKLVYKINERLQLYKLVEYQEICKYCKEHKEILFFSLILKILNKL